MECVVSSLFVIIENTSYGYLACHFIIIIYHHHPARWELHYKFFDTSRMTNLIIIFTIMSKRKRVSCFDKKCSKLNCRF